MGRMSRGLKVAYRGAAGVAVDVGGVGVRDDQTDAGQDGGDGRKEAAGEGGVRGVPDASGRGVEAEADGAVVPSCVLGVRRRDGVDGQVPDLDRRLAVAFGPVVGEGHDVGHAAGVVGGECGQLRGGGGGVGYQELALAGGGVAGHAFQAGDDPGVVVGVEVGADDRVSSAQENTRPSSSASMPGAAGPGSTRTVADGVRRR